MADLKFSCFYFPTTVLLVDDSSAFVESLSLQLDKAVLFKFTTDPSKAQHALSQADNLKAAKPQFFVHWPAEEENDDITGKTINFQTILDFLHNPQRFSTITTLVIDYNMPTLTGVELARQLKALNKKYKIIMLTGEATQDVAVNAFNEGLIDKFIFKGSSELVSEVNEAIHLMQKRYFHEITSALSEFLMSHNHFIFSEKFNALFNQILKETEAVEYYLLDEQGSFLLLDPNAQPTWFIIKSETELNGYLEFAIDQEASETLKNALATKKKMPFLMGKDRDAAMDLWESRLMDCTKIADTEYYFSLVKGEAWVKDFPTPLCSYQHYLASSDFAL